MIACASLQVCISICNLLSFLGHEKHEWTSGIAIESVFKFLWEREAAFAAGEDPEDKHYPGNTSSSESGEEENENEAENEEEEQGDKETN